MLGICLVHEQVRSGFLQRDLSIDLIRVVMSCKIRFGLFTQVD